MGPKNPVPTGVRTSNCPARNMSLYRLRYHTVRHCTTFYSYILVASKEIGLEVNAEKTKCLVMSRDQHAEQNYNIKTGNKSFEKWNS